jgi:hypothetical protein
MSDQKRRLDPRLKYAGTVSGGASPALHIGAGGRNNLDS